jgi:hypothetical protein
VLCSRIANSSTADWLTLSLWAMRAKSRFASGLRRTLVNRLVSMAPIIPRNALHYNPGSLLGYGAFLPALKYGVSCAIF